MKKIQVRCFKSFFTFILFFSFTSLTFAAPVPVSPALDNGIAVSASCRPVFSWAADPDTGNYDGYEIAVFALVFDNSFPATAEEMFAGAQPILETTIPAPAQSWTPGFETTGLEAGKTYIWYIRSLEYHDNSREWSEGACFMVSSTEVLATLNQALKLQSAVKVKPTDSVYNYSSPEVNSSITALIDVNDDTVSYQQETPENSGVRTGDEDKGRGNVIYGSGAGDDLVTVGGTGVEAIGNTILGSNAGNHTSTGSSNTFVGQQAGFANQTGDDNVAIGHASGYLNDAKADNVFVGSGSGAYNNGSQNTIIGSKAGQQSPAYASVMANSNTIIGFNSGSFNSGYNNTFIGAGSGSSIGEGHGNVFIGSQAGNLINNVNNRLYIANSDTSSPLIYGEFDNALLRVNGTLEFTAGYAVSDKRWKKDIKPLPDALAKVKKLNGVSYLWRRDEFPDKGFANGRQIGFIAQEVEKVLPEVVNTDSKGYKSVAYSNIVPILVEALKKQQELIERQNLTITKQGQAIAELQRLMKK